MKQKKWNVLNKFSAGKEVLEQLLESRGITGQAYEELLNPPSLSDQFKNLPLEIKEQLKSARDLITQAMSDNLPIVIHGDYDADGICSTAILYKTLKEELKYQNIFYFIPNRFDHGYGLSESSVDAVVKLVGGDKQIIFITVDSGITAVEPVKYIKSLGHKIIITDHHQQPDVLPEPDVLVWYDKIVGAGVAWLLARALGSKDLHLLAFAALATVTDLHPLLNFNRSLVKAGLEVINKDIPAGFKALIQVAGRKPGELTTYDLGWVIGPRLNATGRLVEATQSLELLLENNYDAALTKALALHTINSERQDKTLEMFELAAVEESNLPKIIISESEEYHEGIIGLVAAKLTQKYYRPSIVISLGPQTGKASARSVKGVNIIELLRRFEKYFDGVGGHPMAAGFTIKKSNIDEFKKELLAYADQNINDSDLVPVIDVDLELPQTEISVQLADKLKHLEPFGIGNEEPVFCLFGAQVLDVSFVGKSSQHAMIKLYDDRTPLKAMIFNASGDANLAKLPMGSKIDFVFNLKLNEFNGKRSADLIVRDYRNTG